jgi:adenine-specific DNA-methyltransferase
LESVVDGSDKTGISKIVQWQGGGGFRYLTLGKSLFRQDSEGIVEVEFDNGDLIEAVCKIEGFRFVGKEFLEKTRLHGAVDSKRYCHVTEEFVTQDYVEQLSSEIQEDESLVIYCLRKSSKLRPLSNIHVMKIPRDIVKRFKLPRGEEG